MTETCPFCQTNVMFLSSICPNCRNDRDTATPDNTALWAEAMERRARAEAMAPSRSGAGISMGGSLATQEMGQGLLWLLGGGAVTGITYASASEGGGSYMVMYGAFIYGAVKLLRGLFRAGTGN